MLVDLTIKDFLAETASNAPVPGGGSISALNGAIATALTEMVANLEKEICRCRRTDENDCHGSGSYP